MARLMQLLFIGLVVRQVSSTFQPLREVCRTDEDQLGTCVSSAFCCTAVGGTVGTVASKPVAPVARGSMPPGMARSIGTEEANKGCSYNGECCVLPDLADYDCGVCGLKGDGDISKATVPDITAKPTTTQPPVTVEKYIQPRIVNGEDADIYEYCWQVALMNGTGLFGGGALIARNWVVTAAHKVAGRFLDEFILVLGEYDFDHGNADQTVFYTTALNVIMHQDFNPETFDHNLALVRIPDAPCSEPSVCPICLSDDDVTFETITTPAPTTTAPVTTTTTTTTTYAYGDGKGGAGAIAFDVKNAILSVNNKQSKNLPTGGGMVDLGSLGGPNPFANYICYMTGWGSTGLTELAPVLQEAYMQIIRNDECTMAFEQLGVPDPLVPEGSFCGGEPSWSRGSCYGDGGGPLACQNKIDHTWELWGVISLGTNMCMPNGEQGPTIFTDVGEKYQWIIDTIHESSLPEAADDDDAGKTYKVPECGADVGPPCPDRPLYLARLGGRAHVAQGASLFETVTFK